MKTTKFLSLSALIITLGISGCSKPGCTDPNATNYDSDATESNGTCIYPCTISCYNGGTVNPNCTCDCPPGFTGTNCQTPVQPSTPDCEKYNTAKVTFKNNSSNHTYDIIWDGSIKATLSPHTASYAYTEATGQHTVSFKIHGTNTYACTQANPVLVECYSYTYTCDNY